MHTRYSNYFHYHRVFMWSTNNKRLETSLVLWYHPGKEYLFHYIRVCSESVNSLYLLSSLFVWVWQNRPCHIQLRGFGQCSVIFFSCFKPFQYSFQVASFNAPLSEYCQVLAWNYIIVSRCNDIAYDVWSQIKPMEAFELTVFSLITIRKRPDQAIIDTCLCYSAEKKLYKISSSIRLMQ